MKKINSLPIKSQFMAKTSFVADVTFKLNFQAKNGSSYFPWK